MIGMMDDNKKIGTMLIESISGATKKAPEVTSDCSAGLDACGDKIMAAIERKDKAMLMSGLREAFMMLEAEDEMSEVEGD